MRTSVQILVPVTMFVYMVVQSIYLWYCVFICSAVYLYMAVLCIYMQCCVFIHGGAVYLCAVLCIYIWWCCIAALDIYTWRCCVFINISRFINMGKVCISDRVFSKRHYKL